LKRNSRAVANNAKKEKNMTQMDKEYIEKEYEQAIKEYNAALTEDDLDTARRTMKRLEAIAMQDYGFDYADELAMKKEDCKK
jgi:Na+/phosphate symporter